MKKLRTVGALAGAVLALAGSAPAGAVEADERVVPTIAAGNLSRLVPYNTAATVTFTIKTDGRPLARRAVRACTAPAGGAWTCVTAATDTAGRVDVRRTMITAPVRLTVDVPESTSNQAVTSDTVTLTPQVTVKVTRKRSTMTVAVNRAAGQFLVVKRQDGTRWLVDSVQQVTGTTMTLTGLDLARRYQVVVGDTPTVKGNTSATV